MNQATLVALERRATLSLAGIFSLRMLGIFMILPMFSLYAHDLKGATPSLVGIAMGIYGLTQAGLQIPFGMLSDKYGRKQIITIGLLLFILGSVVAALADSITGVIIGRALQGAGAIGSTTFALVADLTREEQRTKAMAIIGMVIGISFSIAMVLGPILNNWIHVDGIFWCTAALALVAIFILHGVVPTPRVTSFHRDTQPVPELFSTILRTPELLRLNFGIFILHAILTACFVALPIALEDVAELHRQEQWTLYLPVLFFSFLTMLPLIIIAEKKRKIKQVFLFAISCLLVSQFFLWGFHHNLWSIALCLFVFFTGFNILEASLPSLISKFAPTKSKGTAMGVYSTSQFLGIFVGGTLGGWLYGQQHLSVVFIFCAIMAGVWLMVAARMQQPRYLGTHLLNVGKIDSEQAKELRTKLLNIIGVAEADVITDDGIAYLKVDNSILNKDALTEFSKSS